MRAYNDDDNGTPSPVQGVKGENRSAIDAALRHGARGAPSGTSITRLLVEHRGAEFRTPCPEVPYTDILKWADCHRRRTGRWPSVKSGVITDFASETWQRIDKSLSSGRAIGAKPMTLAHFLARHRDKPLIKPPTQLTEAQILKWADEYFDRNGKWPAMDSGVIHPRTDESWKRIDWALRRGLRGLNGGTSLPRFLAEHRDKVYWFTGIRLTPELIVEWADHHHSMTGRWPNYKSGRVLAAPLETWANVENALRFGRRGLPGGSSLAKNLNRYRGKDRHREHPQNPRSPAPTARPGDRKRAR